MVTSTAHPPSGAAHTSARLLPAWPGSPYSMRIAASSAVVGLVAMLVLGLAIRGSRAEIGADLWLNNVHSPVLDAISQAVSVGFQPASAVVIGCLLAAAVALKSGRLLTGLAAGAAVACGWLVTGVLKVIVARPRPEWTDAVHRVVAPETDASYPSGHVAFVTALATVLVLLTWRTAARGWVLAGGVVLVAVTALARVYAVVHYPSDVVAGAVCAVCGVILAFAAMEMFERRRLRNGGTATAI
ncbi:phosphatase PAP2 family protein [Microbacterium arabinogalactanolyticum]|uniref:phosphatase PAP2 family protein n=1 Tax=Microbacterium arabinogalactanolyticum TaxID=69365 RepID=UPI002553A8BA|nr:phosphatase PAP2 family protein [Microbacterium arabinogalactanolyticum]GLC84581.1 hypothetical protein MIAR_11690 [Microbacterium arabinogalactanolyticum]